MTFLCNNQFTFQLPAFYIGVLERVSARLNDPAVKDIPVVVADGKCKLHSVHPPPPTLDIVAVADS